ncbi:MAG TPA: hypothetical protein VGM03_09500 [Phycisphaerae bacterium]
MPKPPSVGALAVLFAFMLLFRCRTDALTMMRSSTLAAIFIPLSIILVLIAIPSLTAWRRSRLPQPGFCARCGYNLTGNTSGVCPECGHQAIEGV